MFLIIIGAISFLVGAALIIIGFLLDLIFDIWSAETIIKIGFAMLVTPFAIALLIGAFALLLSLFGLAILF